MSESEQVKFRGRFLEFRVKGGWEYVVRTTGSTPVGILAVCEEGGGRKVILIRQFRVPVGRVCVEIPAGITGDGADAAESWQAGAIRELREETGYTATDVEFLTEGPTSAGLTSECIKLVRAIGVTKVGEPEPDGDERIEVHAVPVEEVEGFLRQRAAAGEWIDPKVWAALYFVKSSSS